MTITKIDYPIFTNHLFNFWFCVSINEEGEPIIVVLCSSWCSQMNSSLTVSLERKLFLQLTYPVLCHNFKWMKVRMSEWKTERMRQMLAEVTVAPLSLSLPWCKSGCWSPEYRWHYTSNPLNVWDMLTRRRLEWPATICSDFEKSNTFL